MGVFQCLCYVNFNDKSMNFVSFAIIIIIMIIEYCFILFFMCLSQEKSFVLFERAFTMECRVSHLIKLMGYHPKYLSVFLEAHQLLMLGDGPLPRHLRVYIAILVSTRECVCVCVCVCVT